MSGNDELVKEMSAIRKAIALYLGKLRRIEEKVDRFTEEGKQRREDEKNRRRERCWT